MGRGRAIRVLLHLTTTTGEERLCGVDEQKNDSRLNKAKVSREVANANGGLLHDGRDDEMRLSGLNAVQWPRRLPRVIEGAGPGVVALSQRVAWTALALLLLELDMPEHVVGQRVPTYYMAQTLSPGTGGNGAN
ncbi:hypothetical protein PCL_07826 [Purpureocillium lilacinum]|uniref:Uncharacterized protein n=1 Tax=Purpureocillium lilacinum TaxID=33203 RepID=A0A2U3EJ55_PURLI|nr:hypothetical protein PCL_07826 [Purpureocillium lilacinum]